MKKVCVFCFTAVILLCLCFVGCKPSGERDFRNYENAAAYKAGNFVCETAAVRRVEIDWLGGNVEVEQSVSGKASIFEDGDALPEEKRLHTYLNDGVLRVKYCRSGCLGKIDETQKNLQVEIPKGAEVEINTFSANVYLGVLETGRLSVKTDRGCIEAESLRCQKAEIETQSGYIGVGSLMADNLEVNGKEGEIHLGIPVCPISEIETGKGNVTLYLQGDVSAFIEFESQKGVLQTERKYEEKAGGYLFFLQERKEEMQAPVVRIIVDTESGNLRVQ